MANHSVPSGSKLRSVLLSRRRRFWYWSLARMVSMRCPMLLMTARVVWDICNMHFGLSNTKPDNAISPCKKSDLGNWLPGS